MRTIILLSNRMGSACKLYVIIVIIETVASFSPASTNYMTSGRFFSNPCPFFKGIKWIRDPTNCHAYFICVDGQPIRMPPCPQDNVWSDRGSNCVPFNSYWNDCPESVRQHHRKQVDDITEVTTRSELQASQPPSTTHFQTTLPEESTTMTPVYGGDKSSNKVYSTEIMGRFQTMTVATERSTSTRVIINGTEHNIGEYLILYVIKVYIALLCLQMRTVNRGPDCGNS